MRVRQMLVRDGPKHKSGFFAGVPDGYSVVWAGGYKEAEQVGKEYRIYEWLSFQEKPTTYRTD